MRGDIIYRVYGLHEGREHDSYFGAFRTIPEAEAHIEQLNQKEMHGKNCDAQYHDKGFVIREGVVETDFEVLSLPKPRDKYVVKVSAKPNRPGTWNSTLVEVFRRNGSTDELVRICEYERNYYSILQ